MAALDTSPVKVANKTTSSNRNMLGGLAKGGLSGTLTLGVMSGGGSCEPLIIKRLATLHRIRCAHDDPDGSMWLDMVLIDPEQIARQKSTKHLVVDELFALALSMSRLLMLRRPGDFMKGIMQMWDEFDARFVHHREGLFPAAARPSAATDRDALPTLVSSATITQLMKQQQQVVKVGKKSLYEVLAGDHVPCDLDYTPTVVTLLDVLTLVYTRFRDENCSDDVVMKTDDRVRDLVIIPIVHRLKQCSYESVDQEIRKIKFRFKLGRISAHRSMTMGRGTTPTGTDPNSAHLNDFKRIFHH